MHNRRAFNAVTQALAEIPESDMLNLHTDVAVLGDDEALGGAPLSEPAGPNEHDKALRKRLKREAKLRRDAARPPDSFERFRMLAELVKEGRQIIDLADHRARYALVVIGVLNAVVFLLMTRGQPLESIELGVRPWLLGGIAAYAVVTFVFLYYVVDCLRPRQMRYSQFMATNEQGAESGLPHGPRGLLYWETIASYDLSAYRRAWSAVRMEQLDAEVVVIAHKQARLIREKYTLLGRLYTGLAVLIVLAGSLVGAYMLLSL